MKVIDLGKIRRPWEAWKVQGKDVQNMGQRMINKKGTGKSRTFNKNGHRVKFTLSYLFGHRELKDAQQKWHGEIKDVQQKWTQS